VPLVCDEGFCRTAPGVGEPCSLHCAEGRCPCETMMCDPATTICEAWPDEGSPCAFVGCGPLHACIGGRCLPQLEERAACNPDEIATCMVGLVCWDGDEDGASTCTPMAGREGDFCFHNYFDVEDGDSCRGPWVCASRGSGRETSWIGTCRVGAELGHACTEESPCRRDAVCVGGECRLRAAPGGACARDEVCPTAFACVEGRCQPRASAGEPCTTAIGCMEGRCDSGVCCLGGESAPCDTEPEGFCAHWCAEGCAPLTWECPAGCAGTCTLDGRCAPVCS
jgi:hypothetical protein